MKKLINTPTLFYIAAALFDLAAIISFVGGNHNSIGIVWLCLGSTFLCLGSSCSRKSKENEENQDGEEKEEK
jgi:hypothetical protein